MNANYRLALLVSLLNVASRSHFSSLHVAHCPLYLRIIHILTKKGVLRSYSYHPKYVKVYFKYKKGVSAFTSLKVVSKPGNRKWWTCSKLELNSTFLSFSGFYVISTSKGLLTTQEALIDLKVSGEILLKVEI